MSVQSSIQSNRFRLTVAIAILLGAILLLIATEMGSVADTGTSDPKGTGGLESARWDAAPAAAEGAEAGDRSPLAEALNAAGQSVARDVGIVAELLASHLEQFREMPVGDNAEITAALSGGNRFAHAPLPADHPAINSQGELTDRWGTPFFFHQLSAQRMEIRSAGPDRRLHSADDTVWPGEAQIASLGFD